MDRLCGVLELEHHPRCRWFGAQNWSSSLSRIVGEGYPGPRPFERPYFYLHLTQTGNAAAGTKTISPAIRLEPGEVRVFCLADTSAAISKSAGSSARTWRMKPVWSASDITGSLKGGIVLNMTKSIGGPGNFNYKLKTGDRVNSERVEFDRNTYYYIVNMADSWQIKNPNVELMVESPPGLRQLPPSLPSPTSILRPDPLAAGHSAKGRDSFTYPIVTFEEINETPKMVGTPAHLSPGRAVRHAAAGGPDVSPPIRASRSSTST